jgi:hypothetical protein
VRAEVEAARARLAEVQAALRAVQEEAASARNGASVLAGHAHLRAGDDEHEGSPGPSAISPAPRVTVTAGNGVRAEVLWQPRAASGGSTSAGKGTGPSDRSTAADADSVAGGARVGVWDGRHRYVDDDRHEGQESYGRSPYGAW